MTKKETKLAGKIWNLMHLLWPCGDRGRCWRCKTAVALYGAMTGKAIGYDQMDRAAADKDRL